MLKTLLILMFSAGLCGSGLTAAATDDPGHGPVVVGKCDGSKRLTMPYEDGSPAIKIQIDGQPVTASIGTGAPVTFVTRNLVGPDRPRTDPKTFTSYYGDFQAAEVMIDTIDLGGDCTLKNMPVRIILDNDHTVARELDGRILLGRDIMGQFDWIFDAPENQLRVRRAEAPRDRVGRFYAIGYDDGQAQHKCVFDSGFGLGKTVTRQETMHIHVGSPILEGPVALQSLGTREEPASPTGQVKLVAITGRIAGGAWQSFIAAISEPTNPMDSAGNHCSIGARYMLDNTVLLRADRHQISNLNDIEH